MTVNELRESRGESKEQFAFSVGVSPRTIYRWERAGWEITEKAMTPEFRRKLARMAK